MDITNPSGNIDYLGYFTKQLPRDLAALAQLRDELEKRRGAMSAVEDANRLRVEAQKIKADAEAEAKKQLDESTQQLKAAHNHHVELAKREASLANKIGVFDKDYNERSTQLDNRAKDIHRQEKALQDRETRLLADTDALFAAKAKLEEDRAALDERVKAFQMKVAALTA
jgi:chromosome segregation ATPase